MDSPIAGVIFDLGGVLVEWNNSVTYRYIEREYGIDFETAKRELEKKLPLVQMGKLSEGEWLEEFFKSQGINPPEGFDEIWGKTFKNARINYEVLEIVKALKQKGLKLATLSNIEASRAAEMRRRGVLDIFDVIIFSCDVGTRKVSGLRYNGPAGKNIFTMTITELGLNQRECLYIDDTSECIEAAFEAGVEGILFVNPGQLKKELMALKLV